MGPTMTTHQSSTRICTTLPPTSTSSRASLATNTSHGPSFKPLPPLTQSATPPAATSISTRRRLLVTTRIIQSQTSVLTETSSVLMRTSLLPKVCSSISSSWEPMSPRPSGRTQPRRPTTITLQSSTKTCMMLPLTLTSSKVNSATSTSHGPSSKLMLPVIQSAPLLDAVSTSTQRRTQVTTWTTQLPTGVIRTKTSSHTTKTSQSPKRSLVTTGTSFSRSHH